MYRHILVATDGSAISGAAVRAGVDLAKVAGARITFVTWKNGCDVIAMGSHGDRGIAGVAGRRPGQ